MKTNMVITVIMVSCGITVMSEETKIRFDNYKVYRFVPSNEAEVETLNSLGTTFPEVIYWKHGGQVGKPFDIMIPPNLQNEILSGFQAATMDVSKPWINNVQELIDEEETKSVLGQANLESHNVIGWDSYYDYDEILHFLDDQVAAHPYVASVQTYGTSFEGRLLKLIKISTGGSGKRPIIFIDANIHAREWITNAVATYIINQLLNGQADGLRSLLHTFDFHVAPVLNPDGYMYSRTTDRMWRKTRSDFAGPDCRGADPNRNFGFHWNTGGSDSNCTSEAFMGVSAFSEPETKAISDYLSTIAYRTEAFITLHSYSQDILIPYGTEVDGSFRVPDYDNHLRVGNLVAKAIARRYGTQFEVGNIVDLKYISSGSSADWIKGVYNTTLVYGIELRDTGEYGFLLPPDQIIPSSLEFIDGIIALAKDLKAQLKLYR